MSPTDTWLQHAAQHMTSTHWHYVLAGIVACLIVSLVICLAGVWREVKRGDEALQRQLERSEQRAKAGRHERT